MSTPEQREERYKTYDWTANEKWQSYLKNIYPVPPLARLEKMKRKWYIRNVDKELPAEPLSASSSTRSNTTSRN